MFLRKFFFIAASLMLAISGIASAQELSVPFDLQPSNSGMFNPRVGPQLNDVRFTPYPQNETVQILSDGKIVDVKLPLHATPNGFMLQGVADIDKVSSQLAKEGVYPIEVWPGKALVILYAEDFRNASLGRYQEFIVMVPVTNYKTHNQLGADLSFGLSFFPDTKKDLNPDLPNAYLYVWRMFVTSELAYDVGRQLWGYPKEIAEIKLQDDSSGSSAHLRAQTCEIQLHVNGDLAKRHKFTSSMWETTITGKEIKQTERDLLLFGGHMQFKKFHGISQGISDSPDEDSYFFNEDTDCGRDLTSINFRAVMWQRNTDNIQVGFH